MMNYSYGAMAEGKTREQVYDYLIDHYQEDIRNVKSLVGWLRYESIPTRNRIIMEIRMIYGQEACQPLIKEAKRLENNK